MSGAVCPSCGVAVVPGYVRCPKCHKPLPQLRQHLVGGTAVQSARRFPMVAIVGALVLAAGIIAFFALRKGDTPKPREAAAAETPTETPTETSQPAETPEAPAQAAAPDPIALAANLERALKKERLWATVSIVGDRVDVRSGSCSDKGMAPLLDGAAPAFKAAGLTRMRCLEQSGQVVTERGL